MRDVLLAGVHGDGESAQAPSENGDAAGGLPPFADARFADRLKEVFPLCDNISIDYAVLEKAEGVVGVACGEFG